MFVHTFKTVNAFLNCTNKIVSPCKLHVCYPAFISSSDAKYVIQCSYHHQTLNTTSECRLSHSCQILSDIVRYCQILSDIVRYCQILSDIVRYCQILSDIVRYRQILSDIVRYCQILSDIVRYCQQQTPA